MSRTDAIKTVSEVLYPFSLARLRQFVANHEWGKAAALVLQDTGRTDLSDAIWAGR